MIVSPAPYVSPLAGVLAIVSVFTAGTVAAPFTLWPLAFAIAFAPRPSTAFVPAQFRTVPPFSVRAAAATPIPFASASVATVA